MRTLYASAKRKRAGWPKDTHPTWIGFGSGAVAATRNRLRAAICRQELAPTERLLLHSPPNNDPQFMT